MSRVKRGVGGLKHRRKVMKLVKGFRAARRRNYRVANEALLKSLAYALRFRAPDRTLTAAEVAEVRAAAVAEAGERVGAELRG